jgi:hypothetical protein
MPGNDPCIVDHDIITYLDVKPIQQKLHPVNPYKVSRIKDEIEKLIKDDFIYPVQLTEWVSTCSCKQKARYDLRVYGLLCSEKIFPER